VAVSDCLFCRIVTGDEPAEIVFSDENTVAFLDVRPVFHGHTLLVPRDHYATLPDLPADLIEPYFANVQMLSVAVPAAMEAQGSFVAINNVVSQSVPHLHTHIVPRVKKDGLRGFFWPRTKYEADDHAGKTAQRIRDAITAAASPRS
jgi:histidine triad (HIT) family protein